MSIPRAKVSLTFADDIKSFYGQIISESPLTVQFIRYDNQIIRQAEEITVSWIQDDLPVSVSAELSSAEGNIVVFNTLSYIEKAPEEDSDRTHSADYKGDFTVTLITDTETSKYLVIQERINSLQRNNLSNKIKKAMNDEDIENTKLFGFILEMNTKLDEILSIIRPAPEVIGGILVRGVSISGKGLKFYSKSFLDEGKMFITATLHDGALRCSFASIAYVRRLRLNADSSGLYSADYINLDTAMVDEIVKFIFSFERTALKEARS